MVVDVFNLRQIVTNRKHETICFSAAADLVGLTADEVLDSDIRTLEWMPHEIGRNVLNNTGSIWWLTRRGCASTLGVWEHR